MQEKSAYILLQAENVDGNMNTHGFYMNTSWVLQVQQVWMRIKLAFDVLSDNS